MLDTLKLTDGEVVGFTEKFDSFRHHGVQRDASGEMNSWRRTAALFSSLLLQTAALCRRELAARSKRFRWEKRPATTAATNFSSTRRSRLVLRSSVG